jgi:adenylate cyclase
MDRLIGEHGGRIANTAGDSVLAEFPSVVDAVEAAVEVQEVLSRSNEAFPEGRQVRFRIGVHVGDVIAKAGDLFGEGVNIAARLQAFAEPGAVCISGDVQRHIRKSLSLAFVDLGVQQLKNISEPVQVYQIDPHPPRWAQDDPQALPKALPLPDKPSIAVLPFANLSGDPEQEYFGDGVVEDIITALSHVPRLFVIARNSTFSYKGHLPTVREVGCQLGVRYVLEGSIRRAGKRLRISAQMIEAETERHLWADHFDGQAEDVFELQDQITAAVTGAIMPQLVAAEVERAKRKRPESLTAYDLYLRALPAIREMTNEGNARAIELVGRALEIEPDYAVAAGLGAWAYTLRVAQGWQVDAIAERRRGVELGRRAVATGENDADALAFGGYAVAFLGEELEEGLSAIERAIRLNPNSAVALAHAGWVMAYLGQADAAVSAFEQSIRLSPREPMLFRAQAGLAFAHLLKREFEIAVMWGRRALDVNPKFTPAHRALASALGHLGRTEQGRAVVNRLLELVPDLTVRRFSEQTRFRPSGCLPMILDGLRLSGLPEE